MAAPDSTRAVTLLVVVVAALAVLAATLPVRPEERVALGRRPPFLARRQPIARVAAARRLELLGLAAVPRVGEAGPRTEEAVVLAETIASPAALVGVASL